MSGANSKLSVLLTNDDGYNAPGIRALGRALRATYTVKVVAPEEEQSGVSHAFTYRKSIACRRIEGDWGEEIVAVEGTPADCVKFGIAEVFGMRPDLVISGLNIGENTGTSSYYSGTVGAAREGAFWGVKSVAFSMAGMEPALIDEWSLEACRFLEQWDALDQNPYRGDKGAVYLNVNFPDGLPSESRGVLITRQSMAYFNDRYERVDGRGEVRYRLAGTKESIEESDTYDSRAITNGYITVTPLHFDATAERVMDQLARLELAGKEPEQ